MATGDLAKQETGQRVTYTGVGGMAGVSFVLEKNDLVLDLHVVVPISLGPPMGEGRTWQQLAADLDKHV